MDLLDGQEKVRVFQVQRQPVQSHWYGKGLVCVVIAHRGEWRMSQQENLTSPDPRAWETRPPSMDFTRSPDSKRRSV